MAFRCIKNHSQECDGCMCCKTDTHYYCPICGEEVFETLFVNTNGEVIGCENCAESKELYEVLEDEAQ